jgi:pimeloyl-ACP methyl ester carboxylesterase
VAGVLEALDCGPAHLVGHAFGNRVARCLAVDRPSLVRSVTLLAAGGLIGPATPLGTGFRNATEVKMNGSDCVTVLGGAGCRRRRIRKCWRGSNAGRWCISPTSRPAGVWRAKIGGVPEQPRSSLSRGSMMKRLRRAMATRSARVTDLPRAGHFLLLEQPEAVTRAVAEFVGAGAGPR